MNGNGFLQVVAYLLWEGEQWSFYCTACAREENLASSHAVYAGDQLDIHRTPLCVSCSKEIAGLAFLTPIEVCRRPNKNREDDNVYPSGTEWEADLERYVVRFTPEQISDLISYIAESRTGMLSIQFGSPVIEIQRTQQQNNKPARKRSIKRSGKSKSGNSEDIDLSLIQVIKTKRVKADWQELNCTRNDKMQCHARSFASTLELLTFLEDYGGTLTLAYLPHHQAIVPTITLNGKCKIANSAA